MHTTIIQLGLVLLTLVISDPANAQVLRRIAHSEVRPACISDGAAKMQHYWDLAAFDWGGVTPLNCWYHPQRMQVDPERGNVRHLALALPHDGQGNEDDPRQRLFAHKGDQPNASSVLFTIFGYEEIDDENGELRRDSAVMALRPEVLPKTIRMPRRDARVVNLHIDEAKRGLGFIPPRCGSPYDQVHRIVFAPRERPHDTPSRELLQMFRLDVDSNRLLGRVATRLPESFTTRHVTTAMAVAPKYGLLMMGAVTPWSPDGQNASLRLLRYQPHTDDRIATIEPLGSLDAISHRPSCGVFFDDGRNVFLVVGGGSPEVRYGGRLSGGLLLFHLGPLAGPFQLNAPIASVPLPSGVEQVKIMDDHVVASSRGLHLLPVVTLLETVANQADTEAINKLSFTQHYPLPYDTHGFDFATIEGRGMLFLASGRNGFDVFRWGIGSAPSPTSIDGDDRAAWSGERVKLNGRDVSVLLRTGGRWNQFGAPSMNARGDVTCWAVTKEDRETIVVRRSGGPAEELPTQEYVSCGRPAMNASGEIVFWAAKRDGAEAIVAVRDGKLRERIAAGRYRHLLNPRLADDGSLIVVAHPSGDQRGRRLLKVSPAGDAIEVIFDEAAEGARSQRRSLGTGIHGDFAGDYDISRSGRRIAFIVREAKPPTQRLMLYHDGALHDLGSPGRDMQRPRFGADDRDVCFRRWHEEVLAACLVRIEIKSDGAENGEADIVQLTELARRRSSYGPDRVNPGEFTAAIVDAQGNAALSIVQHVQSGEDARVLGNQLWRYDRARKRFQFLAKPTDRLLGGQLSHVEFRDSMSPDGAIAARVDMQTPKGDEQAIILWDARP